MKHEIIKTENYLLVVDDSEINVKSGNWYIYNQKGIGLRVAQCGTYLPMDAQKIIAHLPLNNSSILEGVDLLPPLEQEDDVEKLADMSFRKTEYEVPLRKEAFIKGYNKAKEKYKYTEEDMIGFIDYMYSNKTAHNYKDGYCDFRAFTQSMENYIQSLSQPKMPIGFECEIHDTVFGNINTGELLKWKPKTTTNSQGQTVWIGSYLY